MFVCNHQASLDLLAMAFMWPSSVYVIAKESVKWYVLIVCKCFYVIFNRIPGLGWHLWLANNIFIRRSERASAISSLKTAAERILNEKASNPTHSNIFTLY